MRRGTKLTAALLALALIAASCGNNDDDDSSSSGGGSSDDTEQPAAGGGASDVGVTDKEIKIGQVIAKTGASATAHADFDKGFEAYIEGVNEKGGIHGRKINVLAAKDDTGDSARNAAEIQGLYDQEKVFTAVGCFPQFGGMPYVRDNKVPFLGCNHDGPTWEKAETALSFQGNWLDKTPDDDPPVRVSAAPFYLMAKLGVTKLGVFSYNHPGSKAGSENICKEATKYGVQCVFEDYSLAFGFTDLGATVEKVKKSGVDFVYGAMDAGGALIIVRSLKRAGINIPSMWAIVPNEEQALASADLIGDYFGILGTPPFDSDEPAMKKLRDEINKRKPGTKLSSAVTNGWNTAHLLETGLKAAGPKLTRQGFYEALRKLSDYKTPFGVTLDYTKSPEEKIRENIKGDPSECAGFLLRGDAAKKKMVQIGEKPTLCLAAVVDKATLDTKLAADKTTVKTSG